jgi:hypothetical protein
VFRGFLERSQSERDNWSNEGFSKDVNSGTGLAAKQGQLRNFCHSYRRVQGDCNINVPQSTSSEQ